MTDSSARPTMIALYQLLDKAAVRVCHALPNGNIGLSSEVLIIDDVSSDANILAIYDLAIQKFSAHGMTDTPDDSVQGFIDTIKSQTGHKLNPQQVDLLFVGTVRQDSAENVLKVVGVQRDAVGRQAEQSRELIDAQSRDKLAAAIRRCFVFANVTPKHKQVSLQDT